MMLESRETRLRREMRDVIAPIMDEELAHAIEAMAEESPKAESIASILRLSGKAVWSSVLEPLAGEVLVEEAARCLGQDPNKKPWALVRN